MRSVHALICVVCLALAPPALGQAGPAELPPADFAGAQYVDSLGCVFMRAVVGGQVQWVARLTADRAPLCGYPPTLGGEVLAADEAEPAAVAEPEPEPAAAPKAAGAAKAKAAKPAVAKAPRKIGCYTSAPVPLVVALQRGGSTVVCTRGDGTLTGWRPPIYPAADAAVAPAPAETLVAAEMEMPATDMAVASAQAAKLYVQVGAFAVAENASGARARLEGLGLPVARGSLSKDGRALTVILAGPFADEAAAAAALRLARSAGFSDAFVW